MLKKLFQSFLLNSLLFCIYGCTQNSNILSDNTNYNLAYKDAQKVLPIGNIVNQYQSDQLLDRNYQYYIEKYYAEKTRYDDNKKYFDFLQKNDIKKVKNIAVESIPRDNYAYTQEIKNKNSPYELNRARYQKIEYTMFLVNAIKSKKINGDGDAIVYPHLASKYLKNNAQFVMGDEYSQWHELCSTRELC